MIRIYCASEPMLDGFKFGWEAAHTLETSRQYTQSVDARGYWLLIDGDDDRDIATYGLTDQGLKYESTEAAGRSVNALFYFKAYSHADNCWYRWALTVPDGPDDRYAAALDLLRDAEPTLTSWQGTFVCITNNDVFKEL